MKKKKYKLKINGYRSAELWVHKGRIDIKLHNKRKPIFLCDFQPDTMGSEFVEVFLVGIGMVELLINKNVLIKTR